LIRSSRQHLSNRPVLPQKLFPGECWLPGPTVLTAAAAAAVVDN